MFYRSIYVKNIDYQTSPDEFAMTLRTYFGSLISSRLCRGFGFATFENPESTRSALEAHYVTFHGRVAYILADTTKRAMPPLVTYTYNVYAPSVPVKTHTTDSHTPTSLATSTMRLRAHLKRYDGPVWSRGEVAAKFDPFATERHQYYAGARFETTAPSPLLLPPPGIPLLFE